MKAVTRLLLPAAATLFVAGCTSPSDPEVATVEITGTGFLPATLVVAPGTEVRWTNSGSEAHSATSGGPLAPGQRSVPDGTAEFDSGRLLEGETFALVVEVEGDYYYWCEHHGDEQMVGTLRVEEP